MARDALEDGEIGQPCHGRQLLVSPTPDVWILSILTTALDALRELSKVMRASQARNATSSLVCQMMARRIDGAKRKHLAELDVVLNVSPEIFVYFFFFFWNPHNTRNMHGSAGR